MPPVFSHCVTISLVRWDIVDSLAPHHVGQRSAVSSAHR
jgi:hypothetical protein